MRVEHIGLCWDFNKRGGFFCKVSRATAERHASTFWHGTRTCKQTGAGFNQRDAARFAFNEIKHWVPQTGLWNGIYSPNVTPPRGSVPTLPLPYLLLTAQHGCQVARQSLGPTWHPDTGKQASRTTTGALLSRHVPAACLPGTQKARRGAKQPNGCPCPAPRAAA